MERFPAGKTLGYMFWEPSFLQVDVWASWGFAVDQGNLPYAIAVKRRAAICKHTQDAQVT